MDIDVVCRMQVDPATAAASSDYNARVWGAAGLGAGAPHRELPPGV